LKSMNNLSLTKKIVIVTAGIAALIVVAEAVFTTGFFVKEYEGIARSRGFAVARSLRQQLDRVLSFGIPLDELVGFEEQCRALKNEYADCTAAMIVDGNGKIVFHSDSAFHGTQVTDSGVQDAVRNQVQDKSGISDKRAGVFSVTAPLFSGDRMIAAAVVTFSLEPLAEKTRHMMLVSAGFAACAFVLAMVLLFAVLSGWVTRPLKKLVTALEDIRRKGPAGVSRVSIRSTDEIGRLGCTFNAMCDDLQKTTVSRDALDSLIFMVSHNLQEPLRSIYAFSRFIEDDCRDILDAKSKTHLERIRANAQRMKGLIENLLTIARLERRNCASERVHAAYLIDEVKQVMESTLASKNAEVIVNGTLPVIMADRAIFPQVFRQLFANAVKFSDKAALRIDVGCVQRDGVHEFYVRDNGPGIDRQYADKIFDIFQRLNRREEYEGTGAGLAIVRKIIEMHKGRIWVESVPGEGATFFFTLPREQATTADEENGCVCPLPGNPAGACIA